MLRTDETEAWLRRKLYKAATRDEVGDSLIQDVEQMIHITGEGPDLLLADHADADGVRVFVEVEDWKDMVHLIHHSPAAYLDGSGIKPEYR